METSAILAAIKNLKGGRYLHITKSKDLGNGIDKISELRIRVGVSYANMAINEGRQTGSLPWGHWVEGLENWVIEHKGKYYLRISSVTPDHPESGVDTIRETFMRNGVELSLDEVINELGISKVESKPSPVHNIKFENIIAIGDHA